MIHSLYYLIVFAKSSSFLIIHDLGSVYNKKN